MTKGELLRHLGGVLERAKTAIAAASAGELCRTRRIMNADLTGIQVLVRSVAHFRGHTQEIIHQTRTILADRYQVAGAR
jgi:hypothetical protein